VVCAKRSPRTRSCYDQKAGHLLRLLLEDTKLDDLKLDDFERYIATRLNEGAKAGTVHKELSVVRGALKSAKLRNLFHGTLDMVPAIDPEYEPRRTFLTAEEFRRLLDYLVLPPPPNAGPLTIEKHAKLRGERALYCMLICFAGPRRGELEAMRWQDHIDLRRNRIRIPKGKTVSRELAIAADLRPWLESFGAEAGWKGPVVKPWANIGRDLPDACRRAGVPRVTPNDLRRTFASWLVQNHVSLFVVATLLGHCNTRMVEQVYGRLDAATLDSAIDKLPGGASEPRNTGVTESRANTGSYGSGGNPLALAAVTNSCDNTVDSAPNVVPRDGVEPPTRGFSGRVLAEVRGAANMRSGKRFPREPGAVN
jgi:integrase